MDKREPLAILGIQDNGRRRKHREEKKTIKNTATMKAANMDNTDPQQQTQVRMKCEQFLLLIRYLSF